MVLGRGSRVHYENQSFGEVRHLRPLGYHRCCTAGAIRCHPPRARSHLQQYQRALPPRLCRWRLARADPPVSGRPIPRPWVHPRAERPISHAERGAQPGTAACADPLCRLHRQRRGARPRLAGQAGRVRGDDGRLDRGAAVLHRRARAAGDPHGGGGRPHRAAAGRAALRGAPSLRGQAARGGAGASRAPAVRAGGVPLHARARGGFRAARAPRRGALERRRALRPVHARPAARRRRVLRARLHRDLRHERALRPGGLCLLLPALERGVDRGFHRALPREVGPPRRRSRHEGHRAVERGAPTHPAHADAARARARLRLALGALARA